MQSTSLPIDHGRCIYDSLLKVMMAHASSLDGQAKTTVTNGLLLCLDKYIKEILRSKYRDLRDTADLSELSDL
jgi:hypothetical protein